MSSNIDHLPSPEEIRASSDISHLPSPASLGYKPMLDVQSGSDLEDLARGTAQGATLGGADELQGALQAGSEVNLGNLITEPSDELSRLKDLYRKYQQASQNQYEASQKRSPYLYGAGQFAGALAPALLTSGASTAAEGVGEAAALAPTLGNRLLSASIKGAGIGAVAGGLGSEGKLVGATPEEQNQLGSDILQGGEIGGVLGPAMEGLSSAAGSIKNYTSKALANKVEESPLLSQVKSAYNLGKEGVSTSKRSDLIGKLGPREIEDTQAIVNKIQDADKMLGQKVGATIEDATNNGNTVLISQDVKDQASTISNFFKTNPALNLDAKTQNMFNGLINHDVTNLEPQEVLVLRDAADDLIDRMQGDNSTLANFTRQKVQEFRKGINGLLNDQIPGYRDASMRFNQFRQAIPETIIGKGVPPEISGVRVGDMNKPGSKLFSAVQDIVQGSELPGSSTSQAKQTLGMLQKNIQSLENPEFSNQDVLNKLGGSAEDFLGGIRKASEVSSVVKQATGVNPQEGSQTLLKGVALGSTTGRGKLLGTANWLGRTSTALEKKLPANLSSSVFDLPNDSLKSIATELAGSDNATIKSLANNILKGIAAGNNDASKNAALFALLQNKDARASIYNMLPGTNPNK